MYAKSSASAPRAGSPTRGDVWEESLQPRFCPLTGGRGRGRGWERGAGGAQLARAAVSLSQFALPPPSLGRVMPCPSCTKSGTNVEFSSDSES